MKLCRGAFFAPVVRARVAMSLIALAVAALAPASAHAALTPGYGSIGSFGSAGSAPGEFAAPGHLAVDDATGNVLVADPGNARVQVFAPSGTSAGYLTEFSSGLATPTGIAVDESSGSVYVSDPTAGAILKFVTDGAPTPTYTQDGTFTSPAAGSAPGDVGSFGSALAVDPTTHDLLVADAGNQRVSRYRSNGAFVSSFDGSTSAGGAFTGLLDIAAGASTVYVVDSTGDPMLGGTTRVERFDAAGASQGPLDAADFPVAAAVDSARDRAVAAGHTAFDSPPRLFTFAGAAVGASTDFPAATSGSVVAGVAVDGGTSGRVYVATNPNRFFGTGAVGVQVFGPAPGVSFDSATPAARTIDVSGTVNPDGVSSRARFEYSDDNGGSWRQGDLLSAGGGSGDVRIDDTLTGLRPNTQYLVRLVASNGTASATTSVRNVATLADAPDAVTAAATDVSADTASLHGYVTPFGIQSTYHFEYGTTADYGQRVPANVNDIAGNGIVRRAVDEGISGLAADTIYHYRLVATNSAGTAYGDDATFRTATVGATARGYEMVSPVDKGGVDVADQATGYQARSDGNAVVFTAKAALTGSESSPLLPRYAAVRGDGGWSTSAVDPPEGVMAPLSQVLWGTVAVSDDQTKALVLSERKLTADAVEGASNVYVRTVATNTYRLVATTPDLSFFKTWASSGGQARFLGASSDFNTIVFTSEVPLLPAAQGFSNTYEWTAAGGLQLVSVLTDGTPANGIVGGSSRFGRNQVSADGKRVYWDLGGTPDSTDGVYLRENGQTKALSVSQRAGDPATSHPASFVSATADGRYAVFVMSQNDPTPLTDDAPTSGANIYRYDALTGRLKFLATGGVLGVQVVQVSDDTSHVYFTSGASLTADATGSGPWLYVVTDDGVRLVASLPPAAGAPSDSGSPTQSAITPDGRYLAFLTLSSIAGYDNSGSLTCSAARRLDSVPTDACFEAYRYDADTASLTCISCPSDGKPGAGDASLGVSDQPYLSRHFARPILPDGTVFFDTPESLVSKDTNGRQDVYADDGHDTTLISPGRNDASARLQDVTPDGHDVFFVTDDQLVGQDRDTLTDLYDARIGGGFASQTGPAPAHTCQSVECSEPVPGPSSSPPAPSQGAGAPAYQPPPAAKVRVSLVSSSIGATQLRVTVKVTSRGRIRVSGARVTATVRNAATAGTYTLKVPLTRTTRAAIHKHRKTKVAYTVSLTPPFGRHVSIKRTRTVGK